MCGRRLLLAVVLLALAQGCAASDSGDDAVGRSLGVEVLLTGLADHANAVDVEVVVLDEQAREAIRRRYRNAVRVTAWLNPVP
jgi:hypothetical protein